MREAYEILGWGCSIVKRLKAVSLRSTMSAILCLVGARVSRMLAFLLPLKVILLAGSSGVPRYFSFALSNENKTIGIVFLSIGAVSAYAFTLLLENQAKRITVVGSERLMYASGVMTVISNQRDQARALFSRITSILASFIFVCGSFVGLLLIDRLLAGSMLMVGFILALFSTWAVKGVTELSRTPLYDLITERLNAYLGILSSVMFFSSFAIILAPFLEAERGSVLVAMLCFILVRNMLGATTEVVRESVSLIKQKSTVNALIFSERPFEKVESRDQRTLRDLFDRGQRTGLVRDHLAHLIPSGATVRVEWLDPTIKGSGDFAIHVLMNGSATRHMRNIVLPRSQDRLVDNEELLFQHISRANVNAPPILEQFAYGPYHCTYYEGGTGTYIDRSQWPHVQQNLLADLWCVELPASLMKIYSSSHRFLHERLTRELLSRMEIALDEELQVDNYSGLCMRLDLLRERIAALPLCLINSALRPENVFSRYDGGVYAFGWGQWSIEPLGAGLGKLLHKDNNLEEFLLRLASHRAIFSEINADSIRLARDASLLELAIERGNLKAALQIIPSLLDELNGSKALQMVSKESHEQAGEDENDYEEAVTD